MPESLLFKFLSGVLLASMVVVGCSNNNENAKQPITASNQAPTTMTEQVPAEVAIELDHTQIPVLTWKMDMSHLVPVKGKVLSDGKPVMGVDIGIPGKRTMTTNENGSFELLVDSSIPQTLPMQISGAEHATIEGETIESSVQEMLKTAVSRIDIYYPIEVSEVKVDAMNPKQVEVHGRAVVEEGQNFPLITLEKYVVEGIVRDAKGNPVEGAVISFNRANGESLSGSDPSNPKGEYRMYYSPEKDVDLLLSVYLDDVKYTLPEGKLYHFTEGTSLNTDIILPETGTIIVDEPPTLVNTPTRGELYWARVIGLSVDPTVEYTISLPLADGSFVLKVAKEEWDKSPSFFQTKMERFSRSGMKRGDIIPSSWIPAPSKSDPYGIVPQV